MFRSLAIAVAFGVSAGLSGIASAQVEMSVRASKYPVAETVDRLIAAVEGKGIKIAGRIDHEAGAKAAGMELAPSVVVMFGNPKLGTPLMQADPRIGLELPMKMLVWQEKAGRVMVGYAPPLAMKVRYGLDDKAAEILKTMTGALEVFSKAAAGAD
jgi:uncharacterized protein (DUF302 family)